SALGDAYARLGKFAEARAQYAWLSRQRPHNLGYKVALFALAVLSGDDEELARLVGQIYDVEGEGATQWREGKACLLVGHARQTKGRDRAELKEAEQLLSEVQPRHLNWYRVRTGQGNIADLRGQRAVAVRHFLAAIDQGERSPAVLQRTLQLLCAMQRF